MSIDTFDDLQLPNLSPFERLKETPRSVAWSHAGMEALKVARNKRVAFMKELVEPKTRRVSTKTTLGETPSKVKKETKKREPSTAKLKKLLSTLSEDQKKLLMLGVK